MEKLYRKLEDLISTKLMNMFPPDKFILFDDEDKIIEIIHSSKEYSLFISKLKVEFTLIYEELLNFVNGIIHKILSDMMDFSTLMLTIPEERDLVFNSIYSEMVSSMIKYVDLKYEERDIAKKNIVELISDEVKEKLLDNFADFYGIKSQEIISDMIDKSIAYAVYRRRDK